MLKQLISAVRQARLPIYASHMYGQFRRETKELRKLDTYLNVIQKELLTAYFQPIVHLETGETVGHEALNRPPVSKSFPSTEHFYEFAKRSGRLLPLERCCRRNSLLRYAEMLPQAEGEGPKLLFVNVNPEVLNDPDHKGGETLALLQELGISPSAIVFELTERGAVGDYIGFERVLSYYREQGFRIAVDDAGSGYNSLKTLVYLKPEFIKLDKSLIRGIAANREQQLLLGLIVDYARASGTRMIAEGIETRSELDYLRNSGVPLGQGYYLGRPERTPSDGGAVS